VFPLRQLSRPGSRTLWGLRFRSYYLRDGRAQTIPEAIDYHEGEAAFARASYLELSDSEREALLEFLYSR